VIPSGAYSLHIGPAFLNSLRRLSAPERAEIRRLLDLIQRDPSIDTVHKLLPSPEALYIT